MLRQRAEAVWARYEDPESGELPQLTERQREVLMLVRQGLSTGEIAEHLEISTGTVQVHLGDAFDRLRVRGRDEAAEAAARLGLL